MLKKYGLFILLFISGCASIPKESVQLNQEVGKGITTYHQAYINLLNDYFTQKRSAIDEFIQGKYLPKFMDNVKVKLSKAGENPDTMDAEMVKDIVIRVTRLRDKMQADLEKTRLALLDSVTVNYMVLNQANITITKLLQSAVDVNEATSSLKTTIGNMTYNKINFDKLDSKFNEYLKSCGDKSTEAVSLYETTKELLNNK